MKLQLTHITFIFGLILAVCNNPILFFLSSTILGILTPYLRKSHIQSYLKRYSNFIYGFVLGSLITHFLVVILGIIVGYITSEYFELRKYRTINKLLARFSLKIENNVLETSR